MARFVPLATVSLITAAVHLTAQSKVNKLRSRPDVYPLELLSKEPDGDEVIVTRPDGTRIRAISKGEGPTVVLAHGYGVSLVEWNVLWRDLLAAKYHVIAFDQRGHGKSTIGADGIGSRSMAEDYRAVLEHFDARDAILVGHSMGGFLATVFMLDHRDSARERLRGSVLLAAHAGDVLRGAPQNRLQVQMIKAGFMNRMVRSKTYGYLLGLSLMGDAPFPAAIEAFNQAFLAQQHDRLVPILEAMSHENYYPQLREIEIPCVVVCGEQDRTAPAWHSERLGRDIPRARNAWVKGKGHLLNWEAPEIILGAITSLGAASHIGATSGRS